MDVLKINDDDDDTWNFAVVMHMKIVPLWWMNPEPIKLSMRVVNNSYCVKTYGSNWNFFKGL